MIGQRILLDFSGYSDIAIGCARMFGIKLPHNFTWPYLACSIADFWRRWHISLSSWIRDYVYVPLGGNRKGPLRKVVNGLLAFALCGLWHDAAFHFLIWGVYRGVGLAVVASYRRVLGRTGERIGRFMDRTRIAGWVLTFVFVHIGWLFFFYPVSNALYLARHIFQ